MGIVGDGKVVGSIVKPEEYIILGEKARWWNLANDDDLAKYERLSKPFQDRLRAWYAENCRRRANIGNA